MLFRGEARQQQNSTDLEKLEKDLELHKELSLNYEIVTKLAIVCIKKGIKLVIENPNGTFHYLNKYWCLKPKVIDNDRRTRGDYFKKPTQYWFINFDPTFRPLFEMQIDNSVGIKDPLASNMSKVKKALGLENLSTTKVRSMIHKDYANRFIREFIL